MSRTPRGWTKSKEEPCLFVRVDYPGESTMSFIKPRRTYQDVDGQLVVVIDREDVR